MHVSACQCTTHDQLMIRWQKSAKVHIRSPGGNWTSPNGDPCLMYDLDFSKVQQILHLFTDQEQITSGDMVAGLNYETRPPASIGWVALSSMFVCSSRIGNTSSHLHYMMFQTIQTIYFLWGYDPGNMSVSFITELSPVYCCLVTCIIYTVYNIYCV